MLTLLATPIGNLGDMSPRMREALEQATLLACEDTRRTGQLLQRLGIKPPKLVSYHKDNEAARTAELVPLMVKGQSVTLISDSGLPAISDPGARLVAAARAAGVSVGVIPGPSAVAMAVAGSGLEGPFLFHGFLPRKAGERKSLLARLAGYPETLVFYESPNRVAGTVAELAGALGNRFAVLARELTKLHEEWLAAPLEELAETLVNRDIKGECVLVVAGNSGEGERAEVADAAIVARLAAVGHAKEVAAWLAAETGISKREAYQRVLALQPRK
ncbi:MAG: 16S rRNA (cytidine(1402)-2'-O)-methyltransferase [Pseudomonadaceae bacterium]|nr:16S rRNA (cytidine(1402)-2'-O)-methyltransferase [Pseudomonadaceae bacterium]